MAYISIDKLGIGSEINTRIHAVYITVHHVITYYNILNILSWSLT